MARKTVRSSLASSSYIIHTCHSMTIPYDERLTNKWRILLKCWAIHINLYLMQVTSLVHMPNGKVYDPLIGQWMSPLWENVLERVANPTQLHLYRLNGNDPINIAINRERPKGMVQFYRILI